MPCRVRPAGRLVRSLFSAPGFPLGSDHPLFYSALDAGAFSSEITPISLSSRKKGAEPALFTQDEHPRPQATLEALAKLPAVFAKGGVVTAGNASGICDGAAANVVVSEEALKRYGLKPLARVLSYHVVAVEPSIMGASQFFAQCLGREENLQCACIQVSDPWRRSRVPLRKRR
jgi:hypothetical protein